jgi:hypothetical protein
MLSATASKNAPSGADVKHTTSSEGGDFGV